jgi:hypothetical protein
MRRVLLILGQREALQRGRAERHLMLLLGLLGPEAVAVLRPIALLLLLRRLLLLELLLGSLLGLLLLLLRP